MGMDIVRMRVRVRKPLGITDSTDPDLDDNDVDEYLNNSFWEIQDKFPFREKERIGTFDTIAGTRNYEMPKPFECLRALAITDPVTLQHTPLILMDDSEYEEKYNEDPSHYGKPQKYIREGCFARLWPTPDQDYVITIRRNIILDDLSNDNSTSPLPQVWTEIIIYGAIWRAFIDFGDLARSKEIKAHQVSLLTTVRSTESKELDDVQMAGLEVMGREYDHSDLPSHHKW